MVHVAAGADRGRGTDRDGRCDQTRLAGPPGPAQIPGLEIETLALTFNEMLDNIETVVGDMRDLTDNIAHDLRNPIAAIRAGRNWRWPRASPARHWRRPPPPPLPTATNCCR